VLATVQQRMANKEQRHTTQKSAIELRLSGRVGAWEQSLMTVEANLAAKISGPSDFIEVQFQQFKAQGRSKSPSDRAGAGPRPSIRATGLPPAEGADTAWYSASFRVRQPDNQDETGGGGPVRKEGVARL